jgi:hypothetical protein
MFRSGPRSSPAPGVVGSVVKLLDSYRHAGRMPFFPSMVIPRVSSISGGDGILLIELLKRKNRCIRSGEPTLPSPHERRQICDVIPSSLGGSSRMDLRVLPSPDVLVADLEEDINTSISRAMVLVTQFHERSTASIPR